LWQKISSAIENNQKFVITTHVNPDGDALGSELALAEHLRNLGKKVTIINSDTLPYGYRFLDRRRKVKKYTTPKYTAVIQQAEVIFVVDASGGWKRVGPIGDALKQAKALKICIDHHPDPVDFVDIAVIDTNAAAASELIYDLIVSMGGELTLSMAQVLYAGIITDTGNFRFPKTSPHTHHIVAELLSKGVSPLETYSQIYQQASVGLVQLRGHVMNSMTLTADGQIAYYTLDQETLKDYGVKTSELDGFASLGQEIKGVRVVIFGLEIPKGRVKISLRSDNSIAINSIVMEYGGGGHPSAAGATINGNLQWVTVEIIEKVKALLDVTPLVTL